MNKLTDFIHISPGFKAAVNLRKEQENLQKVAGFVPTEVAREIILDLAQKLHPTTPDLRSRIVMGTYGTGKSHLALVLLNFYLRPLATNELQTVVDKLDPDTKSVLAQYRKVVPDNFLVVNLYGDEGYIADGLMLGLRRALEGKELGHLLPDSAFDAALKRISDLEQTYPDSYELLIRELEKHQMTVDEIKTRLGEYQRHSFDLFRDIHPAFSGGSRFDYTTMLDPSVFYESVVAELREKHGFGGIAIFWDEFGHKMEEVVKDPTGKEGLILQNFAESCNSSAENQIHLYLFCHRSLKEYHDISKSAYGGGNQQLEDDLRKIEGRFKQYILKSTDLETFQLIDGVIVADETTAGWNRITTQFQEYFDTLVQETASHKYFTGFTSEELRKIVILGTYPLHPMAVYNLPAISEKVAQNNRTLFTCLCEDEPGSFYRYLSRAEYDETDKYPPMFTVDQLWDYFSNDIKQQERTSSIYRDYENLKTRLDDDDTLGQRLLKAVSIFRVTNPARFKITEEILAYSLSICDDDKTTFSDSLKHHSNLQNENHILMKLQADGSYRPAVSSATESLIQKVKKLLEKTPEKLNQAPIQYLKSLWDRFSVNDVCEATSYKDDFGVSRNLKVEPISFNQLKESLHTLTKNINNGSFIDGLLLVVICSNSAEIEEAKIIATSTLAEDEYQQVVLAIPKSPVNVLAPLKEHQALTYLKNNEASLYAEGGELYEEWIVWEKDKYSQLSEIVDELFAPEKQMLEYYWRGNTNEVNNNRQYKKLASTVMSHVFPYTPFIGEPKLALDDFGGNWGYRPNCRDIVLKLTHKDAPQTLWGETAAAPKHVISLIFKQNGLLTKNQAGEIVLEQPQAEAHLGAHKVWELIASYLTRARQTPIKMKNVVNRLRKPPYGVKCRAMPLFFSAAAHRELSLGNISFEYQRNANHVEKITSIQSDTIEKVFATPEKYTLVYVNVSSNQTALTNGLAKLFDVKLLPADPPLERVKKVGQAIGSWWRALPTHCHNTDQIGDGAYRVREFIFKPLATIEPDAEQVLLHDSFEHVFDVDEKVKEANVLTAFQPIVEEFEGLQEALEERIISAYQNVFSGADDLHDETSWYDELPAGKQNYIFGGDPEILIQHCRDNEGDSRKARIEAAEKMIGLEVGTWSDELVIKLEGKLESAKSLIDEYTPPTEVDPPTPPGPEPTSGPSITVSIDGKNKSRVFDKIQGLSPNGETMENMLNTTVEQIGKSLDDKERIYILYRFILKHAFGTNS